MRFLIYAFFVWLAMGAPVGLDSAPAELSVLFQLIIKLQRSGIFVTCEYEKTPKLQRSEILSRRLN